MNRGFEVVGDKFRKFPKEKIVLPQRGTSNACAYDFYSNEDKELVPGERYTFWTDVKVKMFFDNVLQINTRSGNGCKGIVLSNTIGYVDADYYGNENNDGNIGICLYNDGPKAFSVKKSDRIAQGCFSRYLITDDDKYRNIATEKKVARKGGFGSTGK